MQLYIHTVFLLDGEINTGRPINAVHCEAIENFTRISVYRMLLVSRQHDRISPNRIRQQKSVFITN